MIVIIICIRGQGLSQDLTLGGHRSWVPKAWESRGMGMSLSPTDYGISGSVMSSPAGSGAEPRPPMHFWHIWSRQNTSGRENSATLRNNYKARFFP